jgi:poly-gamma-glutamate capsule biosynthesis protein CapA/YwtB (metallophosphatase superfamily)
MGRMRSRLKLLPRLTVWFLLLAIGCTPTHTAQIKDLPVPTTAPSPTATVMPATPIPAPDSVWVAPELPAAFQAGLRFVPGVERASAPDSADVRVEVLHTVSAAPVVRWVYALAAPFPSLLDGVQTQDLLDVWKGSSTAKYTGQALWMSTETLAVFSAWWGKPASGAVHTEDADKLVDAAWKAHATWALVPFEQLNPHWKVLKVQGVSVYDPDLDVSAYTLAVPLGVMGKAEASVQLPASNYDRSQETILVMSGVTALSRRTAQTMNEKGVLYPARDIAAWMRAADLTHVSNEVSFNQDCPPAKAALEEALFCSSPEYIRLLDEIGVDIVELTGNHNLDRGKEAYLYTLDLYQKRGWQVYGGGLNAAKARQALIVENHGNKLAFIGCNVAGPEMEWAGKDTPGSATCDLDFMEAEVKRLRAEGVLPIVTLQAWETQDYTPAPMQRSGDFVRLAQAGAVIVSGSQSHVPQGFKFVGDSLIHFGLGNLFFDQNDTFITSRAWIDRHVFYQGRYLGTELYPVKLEDFARPRPMTEAERLDFLTKIFQVSGW